MYMSRNLVDLVDFDFHSKRRLKFLNICVSERWLTWLTWVWLQNLSMIMLRNVVDLVDFDFYSQRRLKILNICVSEKLVD